MTTKLYWQDSHMTDFTARVVETVTRGDRTALILDQSTFYPTGGGQPCDTGWIDDLAVSEVESDEQDRILHWIEAGKPLPIAKEVAGRIDWQRRREMIQQHTGQHLLSQAFFQLFGAETRGFRITDQLTEIDLTLEAQPDEIRAMIRQAEDLANSIVFDNRPVRVHEVAPDEAARLPLRKESFITDCIRVVEIADFDWSPCGGTHASNTGEVGIIVARAWERAKKMTRVHFVCGVRALNDYRLANEAADTVARKLSVGREEIVVTVDRLLEEQKQANRRIRELNQIAAEVEAQQILAETEPVNGLRVVRKILEQKDFEEMKLLAHRLVERPGVVALLGVREGSMARLVFARSTDVDQDMNALMKAACEKLGGRGGGKPEFAQGGGPVGEFYRIDEILKDLQDWGLGGG